MHQIRWFDTSLKLRDGVKLTSRIWVPNHKGPWPALLMRQPYGREIASTVTYLHPIWWASNGYMVIIQDVRGQGSSEGKFQGFKQEANDTSETHEWVRSLKECNGKLGLYGFSYQGLTQLTGTEDSEPPDCLSPAMMGLDFKNHWSSDGGAFWWNNNISWALQMAALKMKRENNYSGWEDIKLSIENKSYLRTGLELIRKYDPDNFIIKWLDIIINQDVFEEVKPIPTWLNKPMLIIGGLWDPHLRGALDLYSKSKKAGGKPEIIIGNASHLNWWEGSQKILLEFFDKNLKSKSSTHIKNKKIWNISLKKWDEINNFEEPSYFLGCKSNGTANIETVDGSLITNSKGSGFLTIVHDPWRPVQSGGGHLGPLPGDFDRKLIDERFDVGVFQTNPFEEDQKFSGIPLVSTSVKSDHPSFDICLALSLVNGDENVVNQFSTGFLRVRKAKIGEESSYKISMHPTNISLKKGSKLRLSISASAYPAIGVNSGSEFKNYGAPTMHHEIITLCFELSKTFMKMTPFFA